MIDQQAHVFPGGEASATHYIEEQGRQIRLAVLFALIPTVVAFSFIVFIFYRRKRETHFRQMETELKLSIAELELKALRAQINPHFIFNCLNSIHHYMHKNDITQASQYLIKFSQLIRLVLETSSMRTVSLADELDALRLYIELEQLRKNHSFRFEIAIEPSIDPESLHLPPMLIQPFVENSIWHGLNNTGQGDRIRINIQKKEDMLCVIIEDNGKGDAVRNELDLSTMVKKTSMGMALIHGRLHVVSKLFNVNARFNITDIGGNGSDRCGKRVELLLPFDE